MAAAIGQRRTAVKGCLTTVERRPTSDSHAVTTAVLGEKQRGVWGAATPAIQGSLSGDSPPAKTEFYFSMD